MMRPEVGAADSNFTWYATANLTGKALVDEDVTSSPAAFPTSDQVEKMYTTAVLPPRVERLQTRTWTDFKAGN
jgi:putrescine transport system substrate-binding protein